MKRTVQGKLKNKRPDPDIKPGGIDHDIWRKSRFGKYPHKKRNRKKSEREYKASKDRLQRKVDANNSSSNQNL